MPDIFRKTYRELTLEDKLHLDNVKDHANFLYGVLESLPASRYRSLAMTKLEESVMWAVKGITE